MYHQPSSSPQHPRPPRTQRRALHCGLGYYPSSPPSLHHTERLMKATPGAAGEPSSSGHPAETGSRRWSRTRARGLGRMCKDRSIPGQHLPARRHPQQRKVAISTPLLPNPLNSSCISVATTPLHLFPGKAATTKALSKPAVCIVATNSVNLPVDFLLKQAHYTVLLLAVIPLSTSPPSKSPLAWHRTPFSLLGKFCFDRVERSQSAYLAQGPCTLSIKVTPAHTILQAN